MSDNPKKKLDPVLFQVLISIGMIIMIYIIVSLPIYDKVMMKYKRYHQLAKNQEIDLEKEDFMKMTHGYKYIVPQQVKEALQDKEHLFLIPPYEYIKKYDKSHYTQSWTEERVFRYMSDGKVNHVMLRNPKYKKATHTIIVGKKGFQVFPIKTKEDLAKIEKMFNTKINK